MIEGTHNLSQYAVPIGRKCYLYKRNIKKSTEYAKPNFIGIKWFRSRAEAERYKAEFDKPITH